MTGPDEIIRGRFHRDRRRVGRVRGRGPAQRRPGDPGAPPRGRRRGQEPLDPHPARLWQDLCRPHGQLVLRDRARSGRRPIAACSGRAARSWAAPHRSTAWSISAARPRISTIGASSAIPAGRSTTCCPISSAPSTRRAAPTATTAPAARSACPMSPTSTRSARRLSTPRCALGFPRNDDFNGASQDGVGYHQTTTRNGKRCSTAVGYLRPAMKRRQSARRHRCARPKRSPSTGGARPASSFARMAQGRTARAASEVILCGGAVNSPQLLMLSGIGPGSIWRDTASRSCIICRGVGQSLQDHYSAALKFKCALPITVNDVMLSNLTQTEGRAGILHVQERAAGDGSPRPRLCSRAPGRNWPRPTSNARCSPFSADRPQDGLHRWSGFTTIVYQLRPESRGRIELKSANPPTRRRSIRIIWRRRPTSRPSSPGSNCCGGLLATPQMQRFIDAEFQPGPAVESDEELLDYARRRGGTVYHPTSTCKMGVDAMAVVDPELRVHGLDGSARRRRLDHADRGFRQHQCGHDHDRREGVGHGATTDAPRGIAAILAVVETH